MTLTNAEHEADAELIRLWESLPKGCRWNAGHRRLHDELAARCAARGRIPHGRYVYLPTDDRSFTRVRTHHASSDGVYTYRPPLGRSVDLVVPDPQRHTIEGRKPLPPPKSRA